MTLFHKRLHVAEEEGEQERADMRAVHVGVGHQHNVVIAQAAEVKVLANICAQCRNQRLNFLVAQRLVEARLLNVENLAAQRENGLEAAVAPLFGRAACAVTLHNVDFALLGVAARAVGQLAGEREALQRALADDKIACLARRLARTVGRAALLEDVLRLARILLQPAPHGLGDGRRHVTAHLGVEQLELVLPLKLRLNHLDAHNGRHALTRVLAGEVGVALLEHPLLARPVVDNARNGRAQARNVAAPVRRVDGIGKGKDRLGEAVGVLNGGFHVRCVHIHVNVDRRVQHGAVAVEVAHKAFDAPLKVEVRLEPGLGALVNELQVNAARQESHLAEARCQRLPRVLEDLKDGVVAHEGLDRARLFRVTLADHLNLGDGDAALKALAVDLAVALDLGLHPRAQRIDGANAHTVQTTGDLVAATAKLAAGVQLGHDNRDGRQPCLLLDFHGNAGAVVLHGEAFIFVDGDLDAITAPLHGLVNGVVHNLKDHVMECFCVGAANIHAGAATHGLQPLKDLNLIGPVDKVLVAFDSHTFLRARHKAKLQLQVSNSLYAETAVTTEKSGNRFLVVSVLSVFLRTGDLGFQVNGLPGRGHNQARAIENKQSHGQPRANVGVEQNGCEGAHRLYGGQVVEQQPNANADHVDQHHKADHTQHVVAHKRHARTHGVAHAQVIHHNRRRHKIEVDEEHKDHAKRKRRNAVGQCGQNQQQQPHHQ